MNAGGEKGETFQQSFHMRILAAVRLHQQAACQLRILPGPLHSHLADIGQLALVIIKKIFPDACHVSSPCTSHWLDRANSETPLRREQDPSSPLRQCGSGADDCRERANRTRWSRRANGDRNARLHLLCCAATRLCREYATDLRSSNRECRSRTRCFAVGDSVPGGRP